MKNITCVQCGKPITRKRDLRILGKTLSPIHHQCLIQPRDLTDKAARLAGTFPLGFKPWVWLGVGNGFAYWLLMQEPQSATAIIVFVAVSNLVFILPRLLIYLTIERHLK